jgi:hypothetical protein
MRRPGAALPLPVREDQLKRRVSSGCPADPVEEHERLRRRQGSRRGGEDGVACLRRGGQVAGAGLGEDPGPGGITVCLAQVHAADARRAAGQHERADHADRLVRADHQVRHALAGQRGRQHRVWPAGEYREVGLTAGIAGGAHLGRDAVHGTGDTGSPARPDIVHSKARRRDVRRFRCPVVRAAHPPDPGRGEERRDAGADPTRAVHMRVRRPPPGQHRRAAVGVPVSEGGAGHLRADPAAQVVRQCRAQVGREVVEQAGRGQQADHAVHVALSNAVSLGGPRHLVGVPRPVEQAHDAQCLTEVGVQRAGAARVDAKLERALVPPQRP